MPVEPLPPEVARHTWDTLAGNGLVAEAVRRSIDERRLPHGLLFHGPAQLGKSGFAVATAKHLIAGAWPPPDDDTRRAVAKIERGTHPDIVHIRPDTRAGRATQIKIEDVREVENLAPLSPIESPWRVVIIDGADRMNPNTANALLKLLEEPPPHCVFILVAHRRAVLLPTVISRCTPLRFAPVPSDELERWLVERHGFDPDQARLAARWSEGRPGAALALPLDEWGERLRGVDAIMRAFRDHGYSGVFRAAADLLALGEAGKTDDETPLAAALRWTRMWLRDQLVAAVAPNHDHLLAGRAEITPPPAGDAATLAFLCALGEEIERIAPLANRTVDGRLALETCLTNAGAARGKQTARA